jgi:hypothetical protein
MSRIIPPKRGLHVDPVALAVDGKQQSASIDGGVGGAPVALFSVTTSALAAGEVQVLPVKTLQLGYRAACFIDEIRISAFSNLQLATSANGGLTAIIAAKFDVGPHSFSGGNQTDANGFADGFIPIGCYAPRWSYGPEEAGSVYSGIVEFGGGSNAYRQYARVRWALPKPLYLGPGDVLRCSVQRHPTFAANVDPLVTPDIHVQVAYIGRVIASGTPPPSMRQIPWVSYMQKLSSAEVASSNQEFRNPFTRPLMVQRFTWRSYMSFGSDFVSLTELYGLFGDGMHGTPGGFHELIHIEDSLGYRVTNDYVPIGYVFDPFRRAWTFSRPIGPREQFNVKLLNEGVVPSIRAFITNIGMVGYRDEVL